MSESNNKDKILKLLRERACTKQKVYRITVEHFALLKKVLQELAAELHTEMQQIDKDVRIKYTDKGEMEAHLTFGGDILIFTMHTNVFTFDKAHFVQKMKYVKEDPTRAYCGVIQVYNFLHDSLTYNRLNDIGYLIGRIFINKEQHFFVEGKRQLGFLYNEFDKYELNHANIRAVVESAMIFAINFDLLSPPFSTLQEMSVAEKLHQTGLLSLQTGKRLGFRFQTKEKGSE